MQEAFFTGPSAQQLSSNLVAWIVHCFHLIAKLTRVQLSSRRKVYGATDADYPVLYSHEDWRGDRKVSSHLAKHVSVVLAIPMIARRLRHSKNSESRLTYIQPDIVWNKIV